MSLYNVSAHNVYYVKYAGFVVKFMRTSLSGTYRRISRLLNVMFVTIYGMNELSKKHLGTQENILTCLESGVTTRFSSHNEAMCK
ncbi:hypothetical protein FZH48_15465 [Salmonella enterica]|nr:hypothetical protein [Salmonella enterica]ECP3587177.1 hypothetical protein [Salmonella enterica]